MKRARLLRILTKLQPQCWVIRARSRRRMEQCPGRDRIGSSAAAPKWPLPSLCIGADSAPILAKYRHSGATGEKRSICCRFWRSEEHTSELQSLMRISYAVFCLKKKNPSSCKKHKSVTNELSKK